MTLDSQALDIDTALALYRKLVLRLLKGHHRERLGYAGRDVARSRIACRMLSHREQVDRS